jgi:hypothetical protein
MVADGRTVAIPYTDNRYNMHVQFTVNKPTCCASRNDAPVIFISELFRRTTQHEQIFWKGDKLNYGPYE